MSDFTRTPNYSLYLPVPNADDDAWGDHLNWNANTLDSIIHGIDARPAGGVTSWNTRTGAVVMTPGDVSTALGYTPYNASNPAGYQTASQVTTSLAAYATLLSPVFTGTPSLPAGATVPTAAPGDADQSLANTAFVAAAIAAATPPPPVTIGDAAPSPVVPGQLWWDSLGGQLMIRYADANSSQWVQANSGLGAGTYLPLSGGQLSGALLLAGNATASLNPVPLQQLTSTLASYATTASVPVASSTTPSMDGSAAVGIGTTWARADHIHPTDTSRYAASNPSGYQTAAQVSSSLGAYLPLAGGTITGGLAVNQTLYTAGYTQVGSQLYANTTTYFMYGQVGDFYMHRFYDGSFWIRVLNFAASWSLRWREDGLFIFGTPAQYNAWYLDNNGTSTQSGNISCAYLTTRGGSIDCGALGATGNMNVGGNISCHYITTNGSSIDAGYLHSTGDAATDGVHYHNSWIRVGSTGVVYNSWQTNRIAWYWNGSQLYGLVDGNIVGINTSDGRLKNVIGGYQRGLAELRQLQPVTFRFKGNDRAVLPEGVEDDQPDAPSVRNTDAVHVGIIAQDTERIFPEMIGEPVKAVIDGELVEDMRTLDGGPWLLWALVNGVKELAARVEALEAHA